MVNERVTERARTRMPNVKMSSIMRQPMRLRVSRLSRLPRIHKRKRGSPRRSSASNAAVVGVKPG